MSRNVISWLCLAVFALAAGCNSAPSRVTAPGVSGSAARDAMTQYDKNSDGALDDSELEAVPGIARAKSRFDKNSDGKVSADEISARIGEWANSKVGLTQYSLTFMLDGRPLEGAAIKFVPEAFLGSDIKGGTGTTDASGRANIVIAQEDLRPDEKGLQGMRLGVYKIEVTHPSIQLPAKYNTATELGVEIAHDDPNVGRDTIELTSR